MHLFAFSSVAFLVIFCVFVEKISYALSQEQCACTVYFDSAEAGKSSYCSQKFGTSQFCFPLQDSCPIKNGLPTTTCSFPTLSPTLKPTTPTNAPTIAITNCGCNLYLDGATSGQNKYCSQPFGSSKICYPASDACPAKQGIPTSLCFESTPSPVLPPTSNTCSCNTYLNGAVAGQSGYCFQLYGTSQFCYPSQTPCQNQNGLPTSTCLSTVTSASPTKSPVLSVKNCQCVSYFDGAVASETSSFCYQLLGASWLCYPDANPCPIKNGLSTTRCLPNKVSASPSKSPSKAPTTTTPSKSPVKVIPTTRTPTTKPGPTMKPTTSKPTIATPTKKPVTIVPTPPTIPTIPTMSPTSKPTKASGVTPIAGIIIFIIVAFILFGGYQYAMEKRKERQVKIQAEQQQQDLSPPSVI